ncbi:hypothetical protein T484DRAFT_1949580 [Baffinella frigidus]|nr:hypothetical protein T484DRAFT_1949580 [Cryptophyta sp. CCMP2293]
MKAGVRNAHLHTRNAHLHTHTHGCLPCCRNLRSGAGSPTLPPSSWPPPRCDIPPRYPQPHPTHGSVAPHLDTHTHGRPPSFRPIESCLAAWGLSPPSPPSSWPRPRRHRHGRHYCVSSSPSPPMLNRIACFSHVMAMETIMAKRVINPTHVHIGCIGCILPRFVATDGSLTVARFRSASWRCPLAYDTQRGSDPRTGTR